MSSTNELLEAIKLELRKLRDLLRRIGKMEDEPIV